MAKENNEANQYDASKIKVLGGIEAVRKRPAMYIGSTGKGGLHHLINEVVDNSVDEALAGHCDTISITIHKDNSVSVEDNGRGIPFDIHKETGRPAVEVVLTTLHAGGKFGDSVYKVSGGLHGVGVSCVNALSEWMLAEVKREGQLYTQRYERGNPSKEKITSIKDKNNGTTITFKPDKQIFTDIIFDTNTVKHRLQEVAFLNKGLRIIFKDERNGVGEEFKYDGGIIAYVNHLNEKKESLYKPPIYVQAEREDVYVETAIQHVKDYYDENIFSFVNCIRTKEGGTHEAGFRTALTRAVNNYAKKNNLIKENETLMGDDAREGIVAIINTRIPAPQFEGQTKTKLGNGEVKGIVDSIVMEGLTTYLDKNPAAGKAIVEKSLLAYRVRLAARKAQELERKKSALDTALLPGKLADCSETNAAKCELFLVEGDSAGGCWGGGTKIALADGRALSFKELLNEEKEGRQNFCYTVLNNGHIGIAPIVNPRMTKKNAKVIKVILDTGEELLCTPDHPFRLVDGTYIAAALLTPKQSLAPLYRRISDNKKKRELDGYEMVFDLKTQRWIYTHVLADIYNLANNIYDASAGKYRHHKDFNKLNNNPPNISRVPHEEHLRQHYEHLEKTLHRPDVKKKTAEAKKAEAFKEKAREKSLEKKELFSANAKKQWEDENYKKYMINKFLEYYNNNADYRKKSSERLSKAQKEFWSKEENRKNQAERVRSFFISHPEKREEYSKIAKEQWKNSNLLEWRSETTKKQWTDEFRIKRKKAYDQTYLNYSLNFLKQVLEKMGEICFYDWDRIALAPADHNILSLKTLKERFFCGDESRVIEAAKNYNHKIKKIEYLEERMDVYDLEVPGTHNFALACGVFVHNSAKQGRDRKFQAILPLRGKILNVEKARLDKILANNEIRTIITAIGAGVITGLKGDGGNGEGEGGEVNAEELLKKLNYHKVILMTDADVDGAHIRTLLLTFFYRYARQIVENGNVYIAQPPLYLIKKGKSQQYAYSDTEMDKILKKIGREGVQIQRYKGLGEMNPEQLWDTTMNPETRTLLQITLEDAEQADEIFNILMGSEVEPRRAFIEQNAKYVRRLDI